MCLLYTEVFIKNLFVFLSVLFSAPSIRKMHRQAIICVHVRRAVTRRLYPRLRSWSVSESSSNHKARKFSRRLIAFMLLSNAFLGDYGLICEEHLENLGPSVRSKWLDGEGTGRMPVVLCNIDVSVSFWACHACFTFFFFFCSWNCPVFDLTDLTSSDKLGKQNSTTLYGSRVTKQKSFNWPFLQA